MGSMFVQLKEGLATAGSGLLAYGTSAYPYPIDECVSFVVGVDGRHFSGFRVCFVVWGCVLRGATGIRMVHQNSPLYRWDSVYSTWLFSPRYRLCTSNGIGDYSSR